MSPPVPRTSAGPGGTGSSSRRWTPNCCEALSRFDHVDVHFSHTLLGYVDDADGVTATVELGDGTQKTIRARYLVGSDGGRSVTRKLMGVSFEGQTSPTRFLVIDLNNDPLGTPNAYLGADPVRPFVSIGLPHGVRRFEYMIFDHETDEQVADPLFVHQLLARHVPDPAGVDFIRQRVYTLHARIAGAFRKGHVLIAGDAAHLMPVWQGQGYNSGVRDATNLAWKLTAILRGIADDALLDTYDTERRDHAKAMIDVSVAMGRILAPTNKAVAGTRDKVAAALNLVPAAKKWIAEGRYKPKPRFHVGALVEAIGPAAKAQPVGSMFPQPRVDTRTEKNVLLDDVLGHWFSVLVWGNDPRHVFDAQSLETLTRLGVKLISIRPSTQLHWDAAPTGDPRETAADVTVIGDSTGRLKPGSTPTPSGSSSSAPTGTSPPPRSPSTAPQSSHPWPPPSTSAHLNSPLEITMTLALVSMSHSPLLELSQPPAELAADVETAFAAARKFITEYDPELVVVFGPDHYNGFFYELMPQFCIGLAATSIGDFGSTPGPLDVPRDIAEGLAQAALDSGVDLAVSLRMEVDHGMVQPLEILFGGLDTVPTVPFFINSVAPPFTPVTGSGCWARPWPLPVRVGQEGAAHRLRRAVPRTTGADPGNRSGACRRRPDRRSQPHRGSVREASGQRPRCGEAVRRRGGQPQGPQPGLGQHLPRPAGRERPRRDRRIHQRLDQGTRRAVRTGNPELDRRLRGTVHRRPLRHHLPLLPAHPRIHRRIQRHHRSSTHHRLTGSPTRKGARTWNDPPTGCWIGHHPGSRKRRPPAIARS